LWTIHKTPVKIIAWVGQDIAPTNLSGMRMLKPGVFFRDPAASPATLEPMSEGYYQLLDATIDYLKGLKEKGDKYVVLDPAVLRALKPDSSSPVKSPAIRKSATPQAPSVSKAAPVPPAPKTPPLSAPAAPAAPAVKPAAKPAPSPARPAAPGDLEAKIEALRARVITCQICPHLASSRQNAVFGVGSIRAELMFVGEAPGADEDAAGEPFVGKAGQLLTKIIEAMGMSRQTVFIANILKCRPDTPGQEFGNRKPTTEEMKTCIPYLIEQIELIRPKVIVALGLTAVEGLLGISSGITKIRGNWHEFQGTPVMPTYHPAYLLRNQTLSIKREVWEDMLQVMERLGSPISEKQRGFFLAPK
jgi:DNA polymerase